MYATYKGKQYKLVKNGKNWELISDRNRFGFLKDGEIYYKPMENLEELDDVYELYILVTYDTGLDYVPNEWRVPLAKEYFDESSVKLVFVQGLLPGWVVEDKCVSSLKVDVNQTKSAYLVKKSKRTGILNKRKLQPSELYDVASTNW